MRLAAFAAVLLIAAGLSSCAAPSTEDKRPDYALHATNAQSHADAIASGMARARMDLARRSLRRLMENPG